MGEPKMRSKRSVERYFESHPVRDVLKDLTAELALKQPDEPLRLLHQRIGQMLGVEEGPGEIASGSRKADEGANCRLYIECVGHHGQSDRRHVVRRAQSGLASESLLGEWRKEVLQEVSNVFAACQGEAPSAQTATADLGGGDAGSVAAEQAAAEAKRREAALQEQLEEVEEKLEKAEQGQEATMVLLEELREKLSEKEEEAEGAKREAAAKDEEVKKKDEEIKKAREELAEKEAMGSAQNVKVEGEGDFTKTKSNNSSGSGGWDEVEKLKKRLRGAEEREEETASFVEELRKKIAEKDARERAVLVLLTDLKKKDKEAKEREAELEERCRQLERGLVEHTQLQTSAPETNSMEHSAGRLSSFVSVNGAGAPPVGGVRRTPQSSTASEISPIEEVERPGTRQSRLGTGQGMGELVMVRHGGTQYNIENRFAGWVDAPLTQEAVEHAVASGNQLLEDGRSFDIVFTSTLKRSVKTAMSLLEGLDTMHLPMIKDWRLNPRHWGAMAGMTMKEAAQAFGKDTTRAVRKVKSLAPPEGEACEWDARYIGLDPEDMPTCESLEQVSMRTMCVWEELIVPALHANKKILVVAHGDTVRILQAAMDGADLEEHVRDKCDPAHPARMFPQFAEIFG